MRGPKFLPAWLLAETDPFVQTTLRGLRAAGLDPAFGAYRFCTNAAYSAGTAGVPTVGFGPGREADAHVIDERLAIEDLLAAARGYRGMIEAVGITQYGHPRRAAPQPRNSYNPPAAKRLP